jgi:hypothetical protein
MRRVFCGSLVLITILLLLNQGGSIAMEKKTKFYQVTYQMENVQGQILINGFVVTAMDGKNGTGTAVLNPWLIGDNELKAEAKKADPSKPAALTVGVSEMQSGDIVSTTDKGTLFSLEIKDKDFNAGGKATAAKRFKSTLDFKGHLSQAGQAKEADVLAYAQKIYALFVKKDAEGVLREFEVKTKDYATAFGATEAEVKTDLRNYLTEELFKLKLNALKPGQLRAVAAGPTKNIWHVMNGKDELISAKAPDGSTLSLDIYVALLDGKLQVVR